MTKKCENCIHITTPKGKQCYTLSRILNEEIRDKGLPFYPHNVIPVLDSIGVKCKRFKQNIEDPFDCDCESCVRAQRRIVKGEL